MLIRNYLRYIAISAIFISAILFHTTATFAQSTVCDNYPVTICVIPTSISLPWRVSENNLTTTGQTGEPRLVNPLDTTSLTTMWFRWSPAVNGVYAVDTASFGLTPASAINTEIAVYRQTGTTFAGLIKLGADDDWSLSNCIPVRPLPTGESNLKSCVKFTAYAGNQYVIQVDSSGNTATGQIYTNMTLINALVPTAANVSIGGRVINDYGRGVSRATVTLTDVNGNTRTATTNQFGYYRFTEIESGQNYILEAQRKGYQFENNPRVLNVNEDLTSEDFIGANPFIQRE
jgi:Carboxypeptidase regulatory-like domain